VQHDVAVPVANPFVAAKARSPAHIVEDSPSLQWRPAAADAPIVVECATGPRLRDIESDWGGLLERALDPNVFMSPALIQSAEQHFPDSRFITLLAWRSAENTKILAGLWSFAIGYPPRSLRLARALISPAAPHAYLATPVVDREDAENVLRAMLNFLERDARMPRTIVLDPVGMQSETMQALSHVFLSRGSAPSTLGKAQRPMLRSEMDGKRYLEQSQSSSSRKKLRQHRRRLEEKGTLEFKVWDDPKPVCDAFDAFLQLEHAGWKGRSGTALLCSRAEAAFSVAMIASMADRKDAMVHALYLDGKPISMQIVLRAGRVAFTWKTAYDEKFQEFSPGMLLLEEYTREFLADRGIDHVDSCAFDDSGFMSAWAERQTMAQVWGDVRRGPSLQFVLMCQLQRAYFKLRNAAKTVHAAWRRNWKGI
jgi:CelD/BcsL family acetyltransferase involved in cellulose biosynthesis